MGYGFKPAFVCFFNLDGVVAPPPKGKDLNEKCAREAYKRKRTYVLLHHTSHASPVCTVRHLTPIATDSPVVTQVGAKSNRVVRRQLVCAVYFRSETSLILFVDISHLI